MALGAEAALDGAMRTIHLSLVCLCAVPSADPLQLVVGADNQHSNTADGLLFMLCLHLKSN